MMQDATAAPLQPPSASKPMAPYYPVPYPGPVPPQLPPVVEPMPDLARQYEHQDRVKAVERKERERIQKRPERTGFFGGLSNMLEQGANAVERFTADAMNQMETSIRTGTFEQARKNFLTRYRLDPGVERLWREFSCRVVNGEEYYNGQLYVSDHYLCFFSEKSVLVDNPNAPGRTRKMHRLSFMIPLVNIVSWQRGVAVKTGENTPHAIHMQKEGEKADSLLIYTNDGVLHQFYWFWYYDHAQNVFDHAWRAAFSNPHPAPVPLPENVELPPLPTLARTGSAKPMPADAAPTYQPGVTYPPQKK